MKNAACVLVAVAIVVSCGGSGDPSETAAQALCNKICDCSSTCTAASEDSNGQPKEPVAYGTTDACRSFYNVFLKPTDGSVQVDPSACSSAVANAACLTDTSGNHFLVPPSECRGTVATIDAGGD